MRRMMKKLLAAVGIAAVLALMCPSPASAEELTQTACYEYVNNACVVIEDILYNTSTGRYAIGHLDLRTHVYTIVVYYENFFVGI